MNPSITPRVPLFHSGDQVDSAPPQAPQPFRLPPTFGIPNTGPLVSGSLLRSLTVTLPRPPVSEPANAGSSGVWPSIRAAPGGQTSSFHSLLATWRRDSGVTYPGLPSGGFTHTTPPSAPGKPPTDVQKDTSTSLHSVKDRIPATLNPPTCVALPNSLPHPPTDGNNRSVSWPIAPAFPALTQTAPQPVAPTFPAPAADKLPAPPEPVERNEKEEADSEPEIEYEVETILDRELRNGQPYYLIKWKGYAETDNTWEPLECLNCPDLLREFLAQRSAKAGTKSGKRKTKAKPTLSALSMTALPTLPSQPSRESSVREATGASPAASTAPKAVKPALVKTVKVVTADASDKAIRPKAAGVRKAHRATRPPPQRRHALHRGLEAIMAAPLKPNIQAFLALVRNAQGPPISVVNDVDDEGPPTDFTYVDHLIYTAGVPQPDRDALCGCQCPRGCAREFPGRCACRHQDGDEFPYDHNGRVVIEPGYLIVECNSKCACGPECPNRVVQRGMQVKLEIFKTPHKGWGVRAKQTIPKGTFISEYAGEILTFAESLRRGEEYDNIGRTYLFNIDHETADDEDPEYTVDAYHYGNVTHFFNHSCEPNLAVYPVLIDHPHVALHRLAFFATRAIAKGEELTFDYHTDRTGVDAESDGGTGDGVSSVSNDSKLTLQLKCMCGAKKCRGALHAV
ncbi:hypothetical protein IWQ60_010856 [Tieghemiomyces parasiticus]|uniref:Uncharacterized protein n=1 Tax=Tieghemiomyces parasiticus TaxID=78921 RepID=A0A9W7ZPN9_9FUNG|nr:hypothetical protein IWQ60_010856 [Tieghemiomyces parasiticus]